MSEEEAEIFEKTLPGYLKHDIEEAEKEKHNKSCMYFDCLLDEVYGSINSAQWDRVITLEEADYLREKYYFGNQKYLDPKER